MADEDLAFMMNLSYDDGGGAGAKQPKLGWKERKALQAARRRSGGGGGRRQGGGGARGGGSFIGAGRPAPTANGGLASAAPAAAAIAPKEGGVPSIARPVLQQQQQQRPPAAASPSQPKPAGNGHAARPQQPAQDRHGGGRGGGGRGGGRGASGGGRGGSGGGAERGGSPPAGWARGADEEGDLAALVSLAMTRERQLQEELGPAAAGHGGGDGGDGDGGGGVVEFGDADDEPDWERVARQGGGGKGGGGGGGSGGHGKHHKQHHKQRAAAAADVVAHRGGEMARAGAPVPEGQRAAIFGDAADADAAPADWPGLGVSAALAAHLESLNFAAPTRVQRAALPPLLAGRDAMVRAPTGSGKTLAYLAPIVQSLASITPRISRAEGTYAIVLSPTRELAVQISDVLAALCRRFVWLVPGMLIGGENRAHEKARLRKGVTVLVATPGRLLDHLANTAAFRADALRWLVLDEADRLLDLGFEARVREVVDALDARAASLEDAGGAGGGDGSGANGSSYEPRPPRQTVLLSATLPPALGAFARQLMRPGAAAVGFSAAQLNGAADGGGSGADGDPEQLDFQWGAEDGQAAQRQQEQEAFEIPSQLRQAFVEVPAKLRLVALVAALRARLNSAGGGGGGSNSAKVVVFFSNCDSVEFHHELLTRCSGGGSAGGGDSDDDDEGGAGGLGGLLPVAPLKLHGDLPQAERTSALLRFAKASRGVLLCTDVAARGLDFPAVTAIVQYDPAGEPSEYVHRVGRTARLGQRGEALMLLLPSERGYVGLMGGRGVALKEDGLQALLRALPAPRSAPGPKAWRQRGGGRDGGGEDAFAGGGSGDAPLAALLLQRRLMGAVAADADLKALAADAFRSYLRAYAVHPSHLKPIFRVRALHLGHVAASFALQEQPSALGSSGSAKERKRRKAEAARAEATRRRKKMRSSAAAAVAGAR